MMANALTVGRGAGIGAHRERTTIITATEARQQFFTLLGKVIADPSELVLVEHKDLVGRAMLVSEAYRDYVRQLEALVSSLLDGGTSPSPAFRLAGSMTVVGDASTALAAARSDAAVRSARKFEGL